MVRQSWAKLQEPLGTIRRYTAWSASGFLELQPQLVHDIAVTNMGPSLVGGFGGGDISTQHGFEGGGGRGLELGSAADRVASGDGKGGSGHHRASSDELASPGASPRAHSAGLSGLRAYSLTNLPSALQRSASTDSNPTTSSSGPLGNSLRNSSNIGPDTMREVASPTLSSNLSGGTSARGVIRITSSEYEHEYGDGVTSARNAKAKRYDADKLERLVFLGAPSYHDMSIMTSPQEIIQSAREHMLQPSFAIAFNHHFEDQVIRPSSSTKPHQALTNPITVHNSHQVDDEEQSKLATALRRSHSAYVQFRLASARNPLSPFMVRQKLYRTLRQKAPSGVPMYECVAVETILSDAKLQRMYRRCVPT